MSRCRPQPTGHKGDQAHASIPLHTPQPTVCCLFPQPSANAVLPPSAHPPHASRLTPHLQLHRRPAEHVRAALPVAAEHAALQLRYTAAPARLQPLPLH